MNRHLFAALLPLSLAAGCSSPGSGYQRPPANTYIQQLVDGVNEVSASAPGYVISAHSGLLRVTWAGYSSFEGSVFAAGFGQPTPGCVMAACPSAAGDQVVLTDSGQTDGLGRVDFSSAPPKGVRSGFDVEVPGSEPVYVDLLVQGIRQPLQVLFTTVDRSGQAAQAAASTLPLGLQIVPAPMVSPL